MKKLFSLLIVALLATNTVLADDVSAEQALQIARQFVNVNSPSVQQFSRRKALSMPVSPEMAHVMRSKVVEKNNVYVINLGNEQGFVVVSGEDGAEDEVLGYCDHGSFSYNACPVQLKDLLSLYSCQVDSLRQNPKLAAPKQVVKQWPDYIGSIVVEPLLTTTWNQWGPYNIFCPTGCPTGCVPTAIAQVMNYWKWPKATIGTLGTEDFSGRTYDWDNMLDDYMSYTNVQAEAVAHLMADIGKAFGTMYANEGSPTYFVSQPLIENFGYEPGIEKVQGLTADNLTGRIMSELDEHRPVLYSGFSGYETTDNGHALVCDGYTDRNYFHFNYGWGGSCDGFYKNALVSGYACNATIFTGVRPYNAEYKVIDGIKYGLLTNGTAEVLDYTLGGGGKENGEVTIPSVVTNEGKEYRVTRIRSLAFYAKGKFDKITIGDNIETIDQNAFIMSSVEEVVFGDKAKEIPDNSFANASVHKLTIGASVKRIGKRAFSMCNVSEITCKSPAFEVDDQAFYNNSNLDTGEWLSHITKLGKRVFFMCRFWKAPNFENLEEIGSEAFYTCFFGGNNAYGSRTGDCTFIIPPKLKSIATDAFSNCVYLSWFYVKDNPYFHCSEQKQPYLLNSSGTSLIMTVPDPIDESRMGDNWYPFPETLVKLEPGCIRDRGNIVIPKSVVEMEGAFKGCSQYITNVFIRSDIPPVISDSTFNEEIFKNSNLILYVPKGSSELYANAPGWRRFKRIIEAYRWGTYYPDDYEPTPPPGRQYTMVVNGTDDDSQQRVSIPISEVSSMELSDDGQQVVIKRRGGKDDVTTSVVSVDSITWKPSFVYENAEVFDLNDSTLTVEAQKCSVTFSSTCIDEDVQLSIRNGVLTPDVTDGITRGISLDLNLSDGTHELSGTADITIPVQPNAGETVNAAYYNEEAGCWEPICFKYDEAKGTVTITTNHLSVYSVFFVKDELSCLAKLHYWGITPNLYDDTEEAIKKLLYIVSSDDPEAQMIREYKDEMSLWQSVGLDGIYNIVTSISEPLLDFKPEALDNAVNIMGYLGTAISILDVVGADINGDNVGVLKGTLSTVLNYASGQMAAAIGTPIMAACSGCVAFIGIALEKLNTTVQEHKRDMFRAAYRYYYSQRGYDAIGGHSSYKADKNNPHGYYRTTKDWYNYLYPIFAEGKMSQSKLEDFIKYAVQRYCDRFWEDNEDIRLECYEWAKVQGLTSYMWISEADMQQICDEYYADLINGEMVSVIQAIKENLRYEASQRYKKTLEKVGAIVNTQYKLQMSDSSKPSDGKSKYAGWQMRFADIPASVGNAEEWMCTIGDDGTATLGYFTVYALLQNEMPFKVVLVDRKGIERKTWDFQISEHTGKRGFKIDLAKSGVEVEAPKLMDLQLTYEPDHVEMPMTFDGIYYYLDTEKNLVKKPMQNVQEWNLYLDNRFNKRARFQKEIEKFFKQHDFITVDDAGHVKIGDDIIGTMTGNEGTGTFTINTSHKFVEKTKAEFVQGFNKAFSTGLGWDIAYGINNLLNGTIKHKIDCEFHLVRNEGGSYTVTFTGSGTFDFNGENVILIENLDWSAWTKENQSITVDDVSTGITEAEGTMKLQYTVKIDQ